MRRVPTISAGLLASTLAMVALAACVSPGATTSPPSAVAAADESIGSLRNARIAVPRGERSGDLVYFAREMSDAELAEARSLAPNLRIVAGLPREEAVARAAEADGADGFYATEAFLQAATRLRWVQAGSAGVERFVANPALRERPEIVLTNMRAVHGPAIAEHVFAMLLALTRDMPGAIADRSAHRWNRDGGADRVTLDGRTLLVVGLGGIGTEIARRGDAFGMRVLATRRSDEPAPPFVDLVAKPSALPTLLAEADVVAIAAPLTEETRGLFDAAAFARMPPGSYLVNIARGPIVVTDALVEALRSGHLAGACLDVTDPEPLPPEHPLWTFENVIITPHIAADGAVTERRRWNVLRENLRRFAAGEPLLNTVDMSAGY